MASLIKMSSHCNGIPDYNVITLQWHPRLQCHLIAMAFPITYIVTCTALIGPWNISPSGHFKKIYKRSSVSYPSVIFQIFFYFTDILYSILLVLYSIKYTIILGLMSHALSWWLKWDDLILCPPGNACRAVLINGPSSVTTSLRMINGLFKLRDQFYSPAKLINSKPTPTFWTD